MHRPCIPPPPDPRDTVPCDAPDDGEHADSGTFVIDPERAATMRAAWAAEDTTPAPSPESALDAETSPALWSAYPGGWS